MIIENANEKDRDWFKRIEDMVKEGSMSLNYIKFYKPRNNPSRFESHSRRYIREFMHNIFIYRDQILPERSYYMLEQNSNNQVSISRTKKLFYDNGIKKTTFTNTINETDSELL